MSAVLWLMLILPATSMADCFFDRHQEGWFWYQNLKEPLNEKTKQNKPKSATETMNALQKRVEESINLAILHPTEENLKNYARNYHEVVQRSQQFTDAYQWMLLRNPEFDYSLRFPVNMLSQAVYTQTRERSIEKAMHYFAKHYGFFFFFKAHCPYCHLFAPTVKAFANKYGVSLIAISLDGGVLKEFPNALQDHYAATRFRVQALPALFAVNPKTKSIVPIANKAVSIQELEETIFNWLQNAANLNRGVER